MLIRLGVLRRLLRESTGGITRVRSLKPGDIFTIPNDPGRFTVLSVSRPVREEGGSWIKWIHGSWMTYGHPQHFLTSDADRIDASYPGTSVMVNVKVLDLAEKDLAAQRNRMSFIYDDGPNAAVTNQLLQDNDENVGRNWWHGIDRVTVIGHDKSVLVKPVLEVPSAFLSSLADIGLVQEKDAGKGRYIYADPETGWKYSFVANGQLVSTVRVKDEGWVSFMQRHLESQDEEKVAAWVADHVSKRRGNSKAVFVMLKKQHPDADLLDLAWWLNHKLSEIAPENVRQQISDLTGYDRITNAEEAIDASKMLKGPLEKLAFQIIRASSGLNENVKMTLGDLRRYLREVSSSSGFPGKPIRNVLSPDVNDREQLGAISARAIDTVTDPDGLPDHLLEPNEDPEDCYGPVPPDAENPYVTMDPYAKEFGPQPFSGGGTINRG